MTTTRIFASLAMACALIAIAPFVNGPSPSALADDKSLVGDNIKWTKYLQRSEHVSAIAMAVASVKPCSKPLHIEESNFEGMLLLTFGCRGDEDEEGAMILYFHAGPDEVINLVKFDFAG